MKAEHEEKLRGQIALETNSLKDAVNKLNSELTEKKERLGEEEGRNKQLQAEYFGSYNEMNEACCSLEKEITHEFSNHDLLMVAATV